MVLSTALSYQEGLAPEASVVSGGGYATSGGGGGGGGRARRLDPEVDPDPDFDMDRSHGGPALSSCPRGGAEALVVDRLNQLAVQGLLQVDLPTLYGLQILASERHPSAMGLGKPKEGFSLFGLANRCVTQMGKRLLRVWFLRPLVNLDIIRDRQDTVELLLRNGGELIPALRAELRKLPDVQSLLQRLALAQQRPDLKVLQQFQSCLRQLLRLRAAFEQQLAPHLARVEREVAAEGGALAQQFTASSILQLFRVAADIIKLFCTSSPP
ncbi:hypothetical protein VOLCADRAFT_96801 [Volvox carteri f. nagariensis]|uniref:DNA mismatch repair protein MutS core domain-containing protein n=1 Tax=Volvox carteri f. nagariensis TaxID=3068 RepID=D8UB35_VOLCA|nr:uncharacterized protein VOLCADRAFT_96801 [Volvox carteri f. nagariensis]EFJ43103.1 hypothetical protein VOLCADRAFT_96801 [Volvox carteri f. nagariensis]|eukprot:XP_002955902.1 hypothetical protein VOLCADRAFT_96801 [Volvox carteri f. nagariensis]